MSRRSSHVWADGAWMPRAEWEAKQVPSMGAAIHRDFAEPLHCMADGKLHGSRSTYDAAVRQAGCVEVGRTEMRKVVERGQRPQHVMPPVAQTLRRFLNG